MEVATYLATVLAGLEPVASSEIAAKVPDAAIQETLRGKVVFSSGRPWQALLALRSIDNLYLFIARLPIGPHRAHLPELEATVARLDLGAAATSVLGPPREISFVVNASRAGHHTYSRFDAAAAAERGLLARHPTWRPGTAAAHNLEFRLDLIAERALFALRLTPPTFRFRGQERAFAPAALRPPVAHALVWLTQPHADDCFADSFCGSGTILAERAAYPAQRILGGDLSAAALATARDNVPPAAHIVLAQWDARGLPLAAGSVDKVATNAPFGHQITGPRDVSGLYAAFARELRRVLAPCGHALVLTDQDEALRSAADASALHAEALLMLSLKGLHPRVWRLSP